MNRDRIAGVIITVLFALAIAVQTKTKPGSWNDISRIAAIESLVERGTWAMNDSPWFDLTQDKVFVNGEFYSDKMPLFSFFGAGAYVILHHVMGASLAPDCADVARFCAYYWLTIILVGIPATLMLWLFFRLARQKHVPLWAALVGTMAFGGTMIFPYALVFNHHVPAAASLFASFFILSTRANNRGSLDPAVSVGWMFAAGLLAALAISFDALAGIMAASLFGIMLARYRSQFPFFALGAAAPLVVTALLDYQIAQTLIPPYLITDGYNYPGSAFPATIGGNGTPDDYAAYAFRMFLGGQGLFAFNPLLLFALAGAIAVALNRQQPLWIEALFTTLGFVLLSLYLAVGTGNFGGTAYGERWFIPAIPVLFSFIFFAPPLDASTSLEAASPRKGSLDWRSAFWKNAAWILFAPLLALSIFSSLQGAQNPWVYWPPPLQMTRNPNQFPIFGFKWNAHWP